MALPFEPSEYMTELQMESVQQQQLVQKKPETNYIKRYSRYFRKVDRAMLKLFQDLEIIDENEVPMPVPLVLGTVERAIAAMIGQTSTFHENQSGQFRRIVLPMAVLVPGDPEPDPSRYQYHKALFYDRLNTERRQNDVVYGFSRGLPINRTYTLVIWTRYKEHQNQLQEIILLKFSQEAEIKIPDNPFPCAVQIQSMGSNWSDSPEDHDIKVWKTETTMSVECWLPQPIRRDKTVLDIKIETGIGDPLTRGEFERSSTISIHAQPSLEDEPINDEEP